MPVFAVTPVFQFVHDPGEPVPPGGVTPSSRTWTSYASMSDVASVPDHDTLKFGDDCGPPKSVTSEVGLVVSSVMLSETIVEGVPTPSRNCANTVFAP